MPVSPLTADRDSQVQDGIIIRYLMGASKTIYKGGAVGLVNGLAQPHADGSGEVFVGIAEEAKVSAASGSYYVRVRKTGVHKMAWYDDDAVATADIGAEVYVVSSSEVSPNASGSGATNKAANNTKCGTVVGIDGTFALVRIDNYTR